MAPFILYKASYTCRLKETTFLTFLIMFSAESPNSFIRSTAGPECPNLSLCLSLLSVRDMSQVSRYAVLLHCDDYTNLPRTLVGDPVRAHRCDKEILSPPRGSSP